jgi:hypothetical protein
MASEMASSLVPTHEQGTLTHVEDVWSPPFRLLPRLSASIHKITASQAWPHVLQISLGTWLFNLKKALTSKNIFHHRYCHSNR